MAEHTHEISHLHVHVHEITSSLNSESLAEHTHNHIHRITHDHRNDYEGHKYHINNSPVFFKHDHQHTEVLSESDNVIQQVENQNYLRHRDRDGQSWRKEEESSEPTPETAEAESSAVS